MAGMFHYALLGTALAAALLIGQPSAPAQEMASIADYASAQDPPVFDDPAKAVDSFKTLLAANDFDQFARLLGLDAAKLKTDEAVMDTYQQIREGAAKELTVEDVGDRKVLNIGPDLWPLPFPITKGEDGKWAFDTYVGFEEIINRRIGENENEALRTVRFFVEAQQEYAADDRDDDGVVEYAQKLVSSDEQTDGLYWPLELGLGVSPAGSFVDEAALEKAKAGDGYFGYRFRILTGQGDNVVGGPQSYIVNGNMISGFALVAWPVKYSETGINTFVVSEYGIVYEADLGPDTEAVVRDIVTFNPDDKWTVSEN